MIFYLNVFKKDEFIPTENVISFFSIFKYIISVSIELCIPNNSLFEIVWIVSLSLWNYT